MLPPKYTFDDVRLAALDGYNILDTPAERGFDDIVHLAAQFCETPVALISLVTGDRQWFKARLGFEPRETGLDSSICAHALVEPDLLVIPDLTRDPRSRDNPLVTGGPRFRFYAGAPLLSNDGSVLGCLCVIDTKPRKQGLTERQSNALRAMARQVVTHLELRRAIVDRDQASLEQTRTELQKETFERQFRTLFDAIDDGFCIIEMKFDGDRPVDYRFVEVNKAFARQTGLADAEGRWMRELAPNHEQHWFDLYGAVAVTGEPARFENPAKELNDRWYEVHAFRVGEPDARRVGILFNDISQRRSANLIQATLNAELSHRMKNTLAMVQAIATQTLRTVSDQEPVEAFNQRIHALSTAHDVLLQQNWTTAEIGRVIRAVLTALAPIERFDITGPAVQLGARATLSMSMLLHELTTNALKYGSLSAEGGRVAVGWRLQNDFADLNFEWRESGGPPVKEPDRKGFGSKLIRMGLVGTGRVDLRYLPAGFEAEFNAPIAQVQLS